MDKILLVEDDNNLGYVVKDNLMLNGFKVELFKDGSSALQNFRIKKYDLCLLDVMLPKKDGFSLAKAIRNENKDIPIIFITAKSMIEDKSTGFQIGADDYITKPFELTELLLRIRAVIKRSKKQTKKGFNLGNTYFDCINYTLKGEKIKKLTKKEGDILNLLCASSGNVIKREVILNEIWGDDNYFNGRSLDVFITKLRKYLSEEKSVRIENIHGIGFCLKSS